MPALPSRNAPGSAIPLELARSCVLAFRVMKKRHPKPGGVFYVFRQRLDRRFCNPEGTSQGRS